MSATATTAIFTFALYRQQKSGKVRFFENYEKKSREIAARLISGDYGW